MDEQRTLHGTHNTSKIEKEIKSLLKQKFSKVITNKRMPLYPFKIDFYIPEIDIYIEYQGHWTHGDEPYDPNNVEHQKIVKFWEEKSKEINYKNKTKDEYKSAIKTWTIRDPLKRQTAKENNLNWIEFFSFKEFMDWFSII